LCCFRSSLRVLWCCRSSLRVLWCCPSPFHFGFVMFLFCFSCLVL
jgi:hypothetical protein